MSTRPLATARPGKHWKLTTRRCATCISASLFADDPGRGERFTAEAAGLFLDYSKNRITEETHRPSAAARRGIGPARPDRRDVSRREDQRHRGSGRPARGPARPKGQSILVDGEDVVPAGPRRARSHGELRRQDPQRRPGKGTPAGGSRTSSTSASAARTWGR